MALFLDEAKINIKAGDGGNGIVSFFFLKGSYKKIASGGHGGRGGNVIIKATANLSTLMGFRKKVHFKAENGQQGRPNNKSGKTGEDLVIQVPVGTIIKDRDKILADLEEEGQEFLASNGGIGGKGNSSFVSQERRFPGFAEKGEKVEEKWINMELRLLADASLIGFPNAGKSTIISRVSAAKPKIADYPFTTLVPNLGVVSYNEDSFVIADIPGIIEGAHMGIGLGDKFLKHVLRSKILVIVLDGSAVLDREEMQLVESFEIIRNEIKLYDQEMYEKDFLVAINKIDLFKEREKLEIVSQELRRISKKPVIMISAATGEGLPQLIEALYLRISKIRHMMADWEKAKRQKSEDFRYYSLKEKDLEKDKLEIVREGGEYLVKNKHLERMISMMDLENQEALDYLKYRLKKMKIGDRLKKMGVDEGSTVIIGNLVFELTGD